MLKSIRVEITTKLTKQQNMFLQLITDIYKTTLLIMLKAEMYISSLNLHLNSVVFQALKRMKKSSMTHQIKAACTVIRRKLCQREQNCQISLTAVAHFKSVCRLDSVLNLAHRRHTKQATESCKKKASSQMKSTMSSQKISLKKNRNIEVNS